MCLNFNKLQKLNRMKIKLIAIYLLILTSSISAFSQHQRRGHDYKKQQTLKGYISGTVVDSLTGENIGYAVIELLSARTGKQVDGTLSDEKGHFKLKDIKTGKYNLKISYLGYHDKVVPGIELTLEHPDKKLGKIYISVSENMLDEIQVVDQRSVVETKIDKIVYNVTKDPTLAGGDATDVLRKVPLLSVDMDGNVTLRGSSKVKILLNGKPSGLFANDVGDALQMFPADEIKKVEVLTSPGAKYDGEGTAGIINIITKKGIINGIKGSIRTFAGDKMQNAHGNFAMGRGRTGVNTGFGIRYKVPSTNTVSFYRSNKRGATENILDQTGLSEMSRTGMGGNIGAFYDFNAYNSINTSLRIRGYNYDGNSMMEVKEFAGDSLSNSFERHSVNQRLRSSLNWTMDYTKKFKSHKDKKLVIATQLEGDYHKNDNSIMTGELPFSQKNYNTGLNGELTMQVDFTQPVHENILLETGVKTILRNIKSDFSRTLIFDNNIEKYDSAHSDIFRYRQNVYAAYVSSTLQLPHKYGIIAGLRYEKTAISGDFEYFPATFENDYDNWFPSITVSKRFKDFSSLKLSYNHRIHRPSLTYINPFVNNKDPKNISYGNPAVAPEKSHQIELGYSKFLKGSMINMSAYYRHTSDIIESYLFIDSLGISNTTYDNIGKTDYYGLSIFSTIRYAKLLQLRGSLDINRYYITGQIKGVPMQNDGITYRAFLSTTLTLRKSWKAELWGFFRSPKYTLQGKNPSFSMYSIGIQKEIWNKKGKIGLRIVQPFKANKDFVTELKGDTFYQINRISVPFRSVGVTFSYSFGKLDFKERRSFIRNDDLKQGGDDDNGDK